MTSIIQKLIFLRSPSTLHIYYIIIFLKNQIINSYQGLEPWLPGSPAYCAFYTNKKINKTLEEYTDGLKLEDPISYYKSSSKADFDKKMRLCISPLYQIADNQGFQVIDKLF